MMSGKHIIHSVAAPNDWVKDGKCGVSVEAENAETLAKAIKKIVATPKEELIKLGKRGQQFCKSKFNYKDLAEQFIKII